jgi:hypothetical protein
MWKNCIFKMAQNSENNNDVVTSRKISETSQTISKHDKGMVVDESIIMGPQPSLLLRHSVNCLVLFLQQSSVHADSGAVLPFAFRPPGR